MLRVPTNPLPATFPDPNGECTSQDEFIALAASANAVAAVGKPVPVALPSRYRLQEIVRKYSNHIAFPIFLTYDKSEWNAEKKESIKSSVTEQINAASAMWQRAKSELKDDDYKELYKSISHDWEDPLLWFHARAEGTLVPLKDPATFVQRLNRVLNRSI